MTQKIDTSHWIDQREIANYLQDVRKHEPLSRLEERELLKEIRKGDPKAKEKLIYSNLRYVITVAKQYQGQGLNFEDLISEMELIVNTGTKINIDYFLDQFLDEDLQTEIINYYKSVETEDINQAVNYFDGEFSFEELKLMHLQFVSDMAN